MVANFSDKVSEGEGVLFYFSGHGSQHEGVNWLVPVDCNATDEEEFARNAKSIDKIMTRLKAAKFRVLILDACRSNQFGRRSRDSATRGLAVMNGTLDCPEGELVCYATMPGATANDGKPGSNGVFTGALLRRFGTPGLTISEIMRAVRKDVKEATGGRQVPWESTTLTENWYPAGPKTD